MLREKDGESFSVERENQNRGEGSSPPTATLFTLPALVVYKKHIIIDTVKQLKNIFGLNDGSPLAKCADVF